MRNAVKHLNIRSPNEPNLSLQFTGLYCGRPHVSSYSNSFIFGFNKKVEKIATAFRPAARHVRGSHHSSVCLRYFSHPSFKRYMYTLPTLFFERKETTFIVSSLAKKNKNVHRPSKVQT